MEKLRKGNKEKGPRIISTALESEEMFSKEPGDWLLASFARLAQANEDLDLRVTLHSGGSTIHGQLIGSSTYLRLWGKSYESVLLKAGADVETTRRVAEHYEEVARQQGRMAKKKEKFTVGYVHLKDAELWNGAKYFKFPLWRQRITEIDGFMMGSKVEETMEFVSFSIDEWRIGDASRGLVALCCSESRMM